MEMPDVLPDVISKFPQFYLLSLTEKIGASGTVTNSTQSWHKQGNTRTAAVASAVANGTTTTATLTLDTAYSAANGNLGYFLVGDIVRVAESDEVGLVTAVGNSGGTVQTIDVVRYNGGSWSTALVDTNANISHIGSAFEEGSTGPGYRNYFPENDWNITQIERRAFKITRDAMTAKHWVTGPNGEKKWYTSVENVEQRNLARDIEATILWGKRNKASGLQGKNFTRGLMEYATGSGITKTFSSSLGVQEADWADLLTELSDQQGSNNLIALCGSTILRDTQFALKQDYRSIPNSEKPAELAGLNFQSYEIMGKSVHFAKYELFSDTSLVPAVDASSTVKDYRNLALILDFSQTENGANIQVKYRDGARMIQKMIPGMPSPGPTAASSVDAIQGELLTEFMPQCFLPNRLGLIYANS
jgi:hypothetical protein